MITSLTWISAVGYIQNIEHQFTFNKPHYKGHTHGLYIYSFCCIPAARNLLGSRDSWYSAVKEAISWRVNQLSPPIFPSLFKMDLVIKQTSRYYTITSEISPSCFCPSTAGAAPISFNGSIVLKYFGGLRRTESVISIHGWKKVIGNYRIMQMLIPLPSPSFFFFFSFLAGGYNTNIGVVTSSCDPM